MYETENCYIFSVWLDRKNQIKLLCGLVPTRIDAVVNKTKGLVIVHIISNLDFGFGLEIGFSDLQSF